jgi:hypothetical protein
MVLGHNDWSELMIYCSSAALDEIERYLPYL